MITVLKLYETPSYNGRPAYWWTQRNNLGICFEIKQRFDRKFAVVINEEKVFAVCDSFLKAEKQFRKAEKIYENQLA